MYIGFTKEKLLKILSRVGGKAKAASRAAMALLTTDDYSLWTNGIPDSLNWLWPAARAGSEY